MNIISELKKENVELKSSSDSIGSDTRFLYPFNCAAIDIPFGLGIYPGKVYEIFGWESVGKSTLSLEITKAFCDYWKTQKDSKYVVIWIECESALDRARAKWMGCPVDTNFLISEPDCFEDTETLIVNILKKCEIAGLVAMFIWDTIAASAVKVEKEQGTNAGGMAIKPRKTREFFRKIINSLGNTNSTLIIVNQLNQNFGMGPDETPLPAIKFYSSVRVHLKKDKSLTEISACGQEITKGIITKANFRKNKLTQRGQNALIAIDNEKGIDKIHTQLLFLKRYKLISVKNAGWCELEIPEKLSVNKPTFISVKFQNEKKLREIIETQYPHCYDWIEYIIYRHYTTVSPLIKVKIINKVWEYEKKFYDKNITKLTDKEKEVALILHKKLSEDEK